MADNPIKAAHGILREARGVLRDPKSNADNIAHAKITEKQMIRFLGKHNGGGK